MPYDDARRRGNHFAAPGKPYSPSVQNAPRVQNPNSYTRNPSTQTRVVGSSYPRSQGAGAYGANASLGGSPDGGKRGKGPVIAGVVAAIVLLVLIAGGICGFTLYRDARGMMDDAREMVDKAGVLKDAIMEGDDVTAHSVTSEVASGVSEMHRTADGIAWQLASFVPVLGQDVQTARTLIATADTLCQDALIPVVDQVGGVKLSNLVTDGAFNVDLISSLAETVSEVSPVVHDATGTIRDLPEAHIGKLNDAVDEVKSLAERADSAVNALNEIMPYIPSMLGAEGDRYYLIMAQTNSEVRSIGGLPGSVGVMTVSNGSLSLGEFEAASALHEYDPPAFATEEEVGLFSGAGITPMSSGIIPDFSRAATVFSQMWVDQKGGRIDGVIAIDPIFLQTLLGYTGGFTTSSGVQVTGENAARLLLHDCYQQMDSNQTDAFFSEVAGQAFDCVLGNLGSIGMTDLFETVENAMSERHLQVYMTNSDEESVMVKLGCSGALNSDETAPEVGFFVNDLTWSKISWYLSINNSVDEGVKNADGTTTYHVTTTMTNHLSPDEAAGLVDYIVGYNDSKRDRSDMLTFIYATAPAGGTISNMVYTNEDGSQANVGEYSYEGRQVFHHVNQIMGGKTVSYSYDVTVSANATEPLGFDVTPTAQKTAGWE